MIGVFLDIETTGLDPKKHYAIDVAFKVVDFETDTLLDEYQSLIKITPEEWATHDAFSLSINGYTWEEVIKGKDRKTIAKEIIEIFDKHNLTRGRAVFICQNPAFDRSFLSQIVTIYEQEQRQWPYHWLDLASMHWALLVEKAHHNGTKFPKEMTLSKNEIAELFGIPPESHPHKGINGVNHLIECYQAVLGVSFSY
ncbi:MAG: 3'-5' exonuclease [Chlamydiales bacterium]|nr:3'-5' exonuclease [Chlamydiales bacterium]